MKKIAVLILIFGIPILIYALTVNNKIYYVALGDSLAVGQNPYGQIAYSYADHVANELKRNRQLSFFTKKFATNGYRTTDLLNDINDNKKIVVDDEEISIKQALTKADVITLSIGANDLFYKMGINSLDMAYYSEIDLRKYVDQVIKDVDKLIVAIKKYCKEDIILIGYYNPLWHMRKSYAKELDPVFVYANDEMTKLSKKHDIYYVDIHYFFEKNQQFLPNPLDIHPSGRGHTAISDKILSIINKNIIENK